MAEFRDLALRRLHLVSNLGRDASPLAAVDLGVLHPIMKRLRNGADLSREPPANPVRLSSNGPSDMVWPITGPMPLWRLNSRPMVGDLTSCVCARHRSALCPCALFPIATVDIGRF